LVVAWVLFPLVLLAVCYGCGLLVERVADWRLWGVLLPATGLALVIVVTTLTTTRGFSARLTTPLVVVLAAGGYAIGWRRLRALRPSYWALAVGLGVYAICAAPVVLSGNATFLGYFVDSDQGFHFTLLTYLVAHGHDLTNVPVISPYAVPNALHQYIGTAYPFGADVALGSIRPLVGQDVAWLFQPYLAVTMGLGAVALWDLLRGVVTSQPLRAACAFIAAQSGLAYAFYLEASIKEIVAALLITVTVVLVVDLLRRPLKIRGLAPLALVVVAGLDVYATAIVPWIGIPIAVFVVTALWRRRRAVRRRLSWRSAVVPAAGAIVLALAATVISGASTFTSVANQVLSQQGELGNLAGPLSKLELLGIWPNGDFRFPALHFSNAYVLIGLSLAGAVLGAAWLVRRRAVGPLLLLVGEGIAAAILLGRTSPYAASKVMMLFSIAVVLTAMLGAAALHDVGRRIEGWLLATLIGAGVLWTNVVAYHDSSVAPQARFHELAAIGSQFKGQGPAFYNLWDTLPIYFLRDESVAVSNTYAGPSPQRPGAPAQLAGQPSAPEDPNDLDFSYLESFRLLVLGRSPVTSRPPTNYRLVYRGTYYDVWQRTQMPQVLRHVPVSDGGIAGLRRASCATVTRTAAIAARDHARVAYATRPTVPTLVPTDAVHPANWSPMGKFGPPGFLSLGQNAGAMVAPVDVPASGEYTVWLQGSFSRRMIVRINGQPVASVRHQIGTAGQFLQIGKVRLQAGEQRVEVDMPASYYAPGNVVGGQLLGPLMLVADNAPSAVQQISPGQARSLCGKRLEWLEVVK
jgi:hypothetical protein